MTRAAWVGAGRFEWRHDRPLARGIRAAQSAAERRRRPLRLALVGASGVIALYVTFALRATAPEVTGFDTYAYWLVDPADPYVRSAARDLGSFFYSPAFAQLMVPFGALPWEVGREVWGVALVAVLAMTTGPFAPVVALSLPGQIELTYGNINILLGAVAVFGLRWPALWAFPLLTKVTPGIGLLWFVFRREWRSLAIAGGATVAIVAASLVLAPGQWIAWLGVLADNRDVEMAMPFIPPLFVRLALATLLLWLGARRDWPWVVPIAVFLSIGRLWPATMTIAAASLWYFWARRPVGLHVRSRD